MTLKQYQSVYKIKQLFDDDVEGLAMIVCEVYNYTPDQVDNFTAKKFTKYCNKIEKTFKKSQTKPRFNLRKYIVNAEELTFGQFITLQHFLRQDTINVAHYIAATIIKSKAKHNVIANKLLSKDVRLTLPYVLELIHSLQNLILKYSKLFEIDRDNSENLELIKRDRNLKQHPFITQFGWLFSANQVAEWFRVELKAIYEMNIIEAFNTLALLKSKQDYEKQMNK